MYYHIQSENLFSLIILMTSAIKNSLSYENNLVEKGKKTYKKRFEYTKLISINNTQNNDKLFYNTTHNNNIALSEL